MKKLIDFYELTMAYSDLMDKRNEEKCYFDVFFRRSLHEGGYNVICGLEEIIDYIKNMRFEEDDIVYLRSLNVFDEEFLDYLKNFKFSGDIYAVPDGTVMFPSEPCITVRANTIEAKIIETDLLNKFNHGSLIATKSRRIVDASNGNAIMEFGARRAQGGDAAVNGAKYAYISGCAGTSCYEAGKQFGVPLLGTMAHSQIMEYEDEYDAFLAYAKRFPKSSVFLVDTVDTLKSGVPNAIKVAQDYLIPNGYRLKGIRLDSGDLAYLSKEARRMLDEAGMEDTKISASNSLDENLIKDLLTQGAPIDQFGVGENLITSRDIPVFGGVYKLAAQEKNNKLISKIKISDNIGKVTNPGFKKVIRFYDKETGYVLGDTIALNDEEIPKDSYTLIDQTHDWKRKTITNYTTREMQVPIFIEGELVYKVPTLKETREYAEREMNHLYPEARRLLNPHVNYVTLSEKLLKLKRDMIYEAKRKAEEKDEIFKKGLKHETK